MTRLTLRDAALYITKLPKAKHDAEEWQAAMQALMLVAEHDGPAMFARIGMMRALHRHKPKAAASLRRLPTLGMIRSPQLVCACALNKRLPLGAVAKAARASPMRRFYRSRAWQIPGGSNGYQRAAHMNSPLPLMSALLRITDSSQTSRNVRFVPIPEVTYTHEAVSLGADDNKKPRAMPGL